VLSINIYNNAINLSVTFTGTFWPLSHCCCSLQQTSTVCDTLSTSAVAAGSNVQNPDICLIFGKPAQTPRQGPKKRTCLGNRDVW